MTRKEFIRVCSLFGIGVPLISSCGFTHSLYEDFEVNFSGKVIVVGAGAAGLAAGYMLARHNIDFEILEAASVYGGRIKAKTDFADFPIDLGAEWIHDDPSILARLISDESVQANIEIIKYSPESLYFWKNDKLVKRNFFVRFYGEHKFKNTTWYDFFDTYIVPPIKDKIRLNSPINEINYSGGKVSMKTLEGQVYEADRVIITVPLTILQNEYINFIPSLPSEKMDAINEVPMPDGIKVFIEFSEKFYPDILGFDGVLDFLSAADGDRLYYDAAFRKDTDKNILALFSVGDIASTYTDIETEEALIEYILNELDEIFDGQASQFYVQHAIQNWSKEPFIGGSYSHFDDYSIQETLGAPVENKLYFAGEAYHPENSSTVHGAAESAYTVVEEILKG